jgi:LysM repeat protein
MKYVVKSGDTLARIASHHHTSVDGLLKANPQIKNPNLIHPGQHLTLPGQAPAAPPSPNAAAGPATPKSGADARPAIAWGKKVSPEFKRKVIEIAKGLGTEPDYLMAAMAFESGETFSPSVKNGAGSGATGLIQFMPKTAMTLGTTTADLAKMSAEQQLDYVEKYFAPYRGKLSTIDDVYMAILYPAALGKEHSHVLFDKEHKKKAYKQNAGLDADHDGKITKAEASHHVRNKLKKGMHADNAG